MDNNRYIHIMKMITMEFISKEKDMEYRLNEDYSLHFIL